MKKLSLILCLCLGVQMLSAQLWFDAGIKGYYGGSYVVNNHISDAPGVSPSISKAYSIGGKVGIHFNLNTGLLLEGLYSTSEQNYSFNSGFPDPAPAVRGIRWKHWDYVGVFRIGSGTVFFELGGQYTIPGKVENQLGIELPKESLENHLSGLFGFGGNLAGNDSFNVTISFRAGYSFQDFDSANDFPIQNIELLGSEKSSPVFLKAGLEMNFGIGYFAKTQCGQKATFFGFQD